MEEENTRSSWKIRPGKMLQYKELSSGRWIVQSLYLHRAHMPAMESPGLNHQSWVEWLKTIIFIYLCVSTYCICVFCNHLIVWEPRDLITLAAAITGALWLKPIIRDFHNFKICICMCFKLVRFFCFICICIIFLFVLNIFIFL